MDEGHAKAAARAPWREHLPAILILGSPVVAVGMTFSVALTDIYLLPGLDLAGIGATVGSGSV